LDKPASEFPTSLHPPFHKDAFMPMINLSQTSASMEDAVRPNEQAARSMYARGYQTWSTLSESACKAASLPRDCLQRLRTAFPNLPHLPNNLDVDNSFSNVVLAKAATTWFAANEPGHLPSSGMNPFFTFLGISQPKWF
jgi:hypothetical protein